MEKKVLLISYRLGYDELLYWDNILTSIKNKFKNFRVFTAQSPLQTKNTLVITEQKLNGLKFYYNKNTPKQNLLFIPLPFFIKDIFEYKPDVIILNEFNLASFYTVLFRRLYPHSKILLLVESDPGIGLKKIHTKGFKHYYRKYIANHVDKILTNNDLGKNYLINSLHLNKKKIVKAPYLTSIPNSNCQESKTENDKVVFLYVGQIIERKGLHHLLEALKDLPLSVTKNIKVNIVGDGYQKEELIAYRNRYNMEYIDFLGKIPFDTLCKYYKEADCFVLPTLHDYRALVGFEALYFGCAIIDSIYDGARFEVVEEGKNGYIVNPKNIEELQEAIKKIVIDKEQLHMFKKYSKIKSKNFTMEKCNNNLISEIISLNGDV